jgi:hypothetical protein
MIKIILTIVTAHNTPTGIIVLPCFDPRWYTCKKTISHNKVFPVCNLAPEKNVWCSLYGRKIIIDCQKILGLLIFGRRYSDLIFLSCRKRHLDIRIDQFERGPIFYSDRQMTHLNQSSKAE